MRALMSYFAYIVVCEVIILLVTCFFGDFLPPKYDGDINDFINKTFTTVTNLAFLMFILMIIALLIGD